MRLGYRLGRLARQNSIVFDSNELGNAGDTSTPAKQKTRTQERSGTRRGVHFFEPTSMCGEVLLTRKNAENETRSAHVLRAHGNQHIWHVACQCRGTASKEGEGLEQDLLQVAPDREAGGSHLQATEEEERIVEWTRELREIRRMVELLQRRDRKLHVKADVAVRRLERLEKKLPAGGRKARSLPVSLADRTKVANLVVDKWFADEKLRLLQHPDRRDRLHPRQRCPRCRSPHDRH